MLMNWLEGILRTFFIWLDKVVYTLIAKVYNLLTEITDTTIVSSDFIENFGERIYALLGIFMLFKVSFSILNYIVNPDDFTDKGKGVSKLITNILITLVLLVATPWIFSKAFEIQRIVIRDNLIGNLILGSSGGLSSNVATLDHGRVMGYQAIKAFYYLDTELYSDCEGIYGSQEENVELDKNNCINSGAFDSDNASELIDIITYSEQTKSVSLYLSGDLRDSKSNDGEYTMSYTPLISTACGVVIVLLLVVFCFDVALRSIKLSFLQLIAPIPIISRVDPKSGKDGIFGKWVKECTKTYLDLFIRLLAIYFALYIISNISLTKTFSLVTGEMVDVSGFARVFIIIGALMFAKKIPELIQDLTGIKMDGKFTLNPMNKLRQTPILGAAAATGAALAGGAIAGGVAGFHAGHTARGIFQGVSGAWGGIKGKVPLSGGDGKNPHAIRTGMQSGYKSITGQDFSVYSPWKHIGSKKGAAEVDELKQNKYALQGAQASLDAELHNLYEQYNAATTVEKQQELRKLIEDNRSKYGKYAKHVSVIDDQIKDVKRLFNVDDSPQTDLKDALEAARPFMEQRSGSQSTPPTHGPNGRGDPVPGQPNPNTSQKKQKRNNQ